MTDPLRVSAQNVMPGILSGWLTKQSDHIKAWRRMWFVLSGHYLYWFKAVDAKEAKGLIELETSSTVVEATVKSKNFSFQIFAQSRNHVIVTSSQQEMESWIAACRTAINHRLQSERSNQDHSQNPLASLMSAFDLSTNLQQLSLDPKTPGKESQGLILTQRQEGRLKKMLIEQLLQGEFLYFRDGPNLDKLKNVHYLRLLFDLFIVKCPIFRTQPPVFWNSLNNLLNNLPRLSRIEQRGEKSKRDKLFRKLQKIGVVYFYNTLRTPYELQLGKAIPLGYDTQDAPDLTKARAAKTAASSGAHSHSSHPPDHPPPSTPATSHPPPSPSTGKSKREEFLENESKTYYKLIQKLIGELVTPGGLSKFLAALKIHKTYNTLPDEYRVVFEKTQEFMCYYIEGALANEARYTRLKKMYDTIPFTALPAILAIANPMKLLSGLLGLCLAKPLGARNLLQRIVKIMVLNPIAVEIDRLKKDINPAVFQKTKNFVDGMFQDTSLMALVQMDSAAARANIEKVLTSPLVQPHVDKEVIDSFKESDVGAVFKLLQVLVKQRDTKIVIEALGDDHLISLVKELFPVLQAPLMELFAQGNISQLISRSLKFFAKLMRIAEAKRKTAGTTGAPGTPTTAPASSPITPVASPGWFSSFRAAPTATPLASDSSPDLNFELPPAVELKPEDIGREYVQSVTEFVGDFYSFLHRLSANDKGLLQDLLGWMLEIFGFVQKGAWQVDLHSILGRLSPEQRTQLAAEVDWFELYRAAKAEKKSRKIQSMLNRDNVVLEKIPTPKLVITPTLAPEFDRLVIEGLKSEFVRIQLHSQQHL